MEFEEIMAIQEIGSECSFINTVGKGNYKYSNISNEIKTYESVLNEIYMERVRFLLNAEEMIEEMLGN